MMVFKIMQRRAFFRIVRFIYFTIIIIRKIKSFIADKRYNHKMRNVLSKLKRKTTSWFTWVYLGLLKKLK